MYDIWGLGDGKPGLGMEREGEFVFVGNEERHWGEGVNLMPAPLGWMAMGVILIQSMASSL